MARLIARTVFATYPAAILLAARAAMTLPGANRRAGWQGAPLVIWTATAGVREWMARVN